MTTAWKILGITGLVGGAIALPSPVAARCPTELSMPIEAIAARPELARARLGIQVETLAGETVYSREGDRFFVPASTLKLLTTAAVLTELGPDYTIRTPVLGTFQETGVATLTVVGQGDPSFDQTALEALARQLEQQGVQEVDWLYGSDRALPGGAVNPNWEWEDVQAGYGAPVNALILNENEISLMLVPQAIGEPLQVVWDDPAQQQTWTVENYSTTVAPDEPEYVSVGRDLARPILRVWGQLVAGAAPETAFVAVPNPSEAFLGALQNALIAQGIKVGQTRLNTREAITTDIELAAVESPPLAELLVPTNQASNNLYAEALLKQLGQQDASATDATSAGIAIAQQTLTELGVNPADVVMVDGSGLARKNLITPAAMVDVLQGMTRSPEADIYRDSLAIAGVSGTLRNRWQDTPVQGRLWGKSGAISRNFALAGYLEPENHPALAFSIFINNIDARGSVTRPIIDEIVLHLAALETCEAQTFN